MSGTTSQYPGSQAFNQSIGVGEYVNRATGAFECSIELVRLAGVLPSAGLHLTLNYASRTQPSLGLPAGWCFNLPTLVPNLSLTAGGHSYVIDPDWADSSGYQSGLRYENNRGISLRQIAPPLPLPYGQNGAAYAWLFTAADGAHHYFDATGKLLASDDRFGNAILYAYQNNDLPPGQTTLSQITDSFGQVVALALSGNQLQVTLPDSSTIIVLLSPAGVQEVVDQLQRKTTFSYAPQGSAQVLTGIVYPTGLATTVSYATPGIAARMADGSIRNMPTVQWHRRVDSSGLFEETEYDFGLQTNGTFTGFSAGCTLSSDNDGLMESSHVDYQYDVTIRRRDQNGTLLAQSMMLYNNLHLPVETHIFGVAAGTASTTSVLKTVYTYPIDPDRRTASPAYTRPTVTAQFASPAGDGNYVPRRRTRCAYDGFGQLTSSATDRYVAGQDDPVCELQRSLTFTTVQWAAGEAAEMPASETVQDLVSGDTIQTVHTLTQDQRAIAASAISVQAAGDSALSPWKTNSFDYDACGRVITVTNARTTPVSNTPGIRATSTSTGYAFDLASHTLAVTTKDGLGNVTVETRRADLPGNPTTRLQRASGAIYAATFDALGRRTGSQDPRGNATTLTYQDNAGGYAEIVTVTDPTGYVVSTSRDGIGRVVQRADNAVPGGIGGGAPTRILATASFNPLGQLASSTDQTGLATTFGYDPIGRLAQRSDPDGNVHVVQYDDSNLSRTTSTNGAPVLIETMDGLGRTVVRARLTANDATLSPVGVISNYCGRGYETGQCVATLDPATLAPTSIFYTTASTYDANGAIASRTVSGGPAAQAVRQSSYVRDLFGRLCALTTVATVQGGGEFNSTSACLQTDAAGNVVSSTDATGAVQRFGYDVDNRLVSAVDIDGVTTTRINHDPSGNVVEVSCGASTSSREYDACNRISSLSDGARSQAISRNLDGTMSGMNWGDGSSQSWQRDSIGRIVQSVDALGIATVTSYSPLSQVSGLAIGPDNFSIQRGTSFALQNVLTGMTVSGDGDWNRSITYDGFRRIVETATTAGADNHGISTSYDGLNRRTAETLLLAGQSTNAAYSYDPLGRVDGTTITDGAATAENGYSLSLNYDGGANVTSRNLNGADNTFAYDAANRLQSGGASYDALGRMTTDTTGNNYAYDDFGRIVTIALKSGGAIQYGYHPDGLLASRDDGTTQTRFYYDNGQANAVVTTSSGDSAGTSFLIQGGIRLAAYPQGGAASYYLAHRGSALALFGGVQASLMCDPYGQALAMPPADPAAWFGWKQVFTDPAAGVAYLRSRHYSTNSMRFLTPDRMLTPNGYAFGLGDPINRSDPSGHVSKIEVATDVVAAIIGIIGIVAAVPTAGTSIAGTVGAVAGVIGGAAGAASAAFATVVLYHPDAEWADDLALGLMALSLVADAASVGATYVANAAARTAQRATEQTIERMGTELENLRRPPVEPVQPVRAPEPVVDEAPINQLPRQGEAPPEIEAEPQANPARRGVGEPQTGRALPRADDPQGDLGPRQLFRTQRLVVGQNWLGQPQFAWADLEGPLPNIDDSDL